MVKDPAKKRGRRVVDRPEEFRQPPVGAGDDVRRDNLTQETIELGGGQLLLQGGHNPDLPLQWYEDLFRKVWETPEWKEFMKKGAMQPVFKGPEEYKKFLIEFENNHVDVMRDVIKWDLRKDLRKR